MVTITALTPPKVIDTAFTLKAKIMYTGKLKTDENNCI